MTTYLNQRRDNSHRHQWVAVIVLALVGMASLIYVLQESTPTQTDSSASPSEATADPSLKDKTPATVSPESPNPTGTETAQAAKPEKSPYERIAGSIEGSLYKAFASRFAQDKENQLWADKAAAHFKRIFLFDINFKKDLRPGDRFALVFEKTEKSTDGMRVLAAWYRSAKLDRDFAAVYVENERFPMGRYFHSDGMEAQLTLKNAPIKDYEIITALLHDRRPKHDGIDFKAPIGTPIITPFDATVLRKNWTTRGNGRCVDLQYVGKPHHALFLHLDTIAAAVKPGARLKAGTVIGTVGNTGRSYAPHLHYQLENAADRVLDPIKIQGTMRREADAQTKETVKALWARWEPMLMELEETSAPSGVGAPATPTASEPDKTTGAGGD